MTEDPNRNYGWSYSTHNPGMVVGMKVETDENGQQVIVDPGIRYTTEQWAQKEMRELMERIEAKLDRVLAALERLVGE